MEKFTSKSYSNLTNTTGDARGLKINQVGPPIIGNMSQVGSPTIVDSINGVKTPNVNAAINDLISISILPINTIIQNTDGVSPQGQAQQLKITFSGKYHPFVYTEETGNVNAEILGIPVEIPIGATEDKITAAFFKSASELSAKGFYFSSVDLVGPTEPYSVNLELISPTEELIKPQLVGNQLNIDIEVVSPAKPGYGIWTLIGTEIKTLTGSTDAIEIYYYKRIA